MGACNSVELGKLSPLDQSHSYQGVGAVGFRCMVNYLVVSFVDPKNFQRRPHGETGTCVRCGANLGSVPRFKRF